ncbi:MAG: bifunctional proline dehydrogenase/L-glutamate gamma-semialdehyde dehydrogenase [Verrucomicrobiae bacterium]|nr:bifunctional proline dehydrogenase/L-glutamate gamma-semialdehyde dehydrogenase [Verrucomicrobiae bacterium]
MPATHTPNEPQACAAEPSLAEQACELASMLLRESKQLSTPADRARSEQMARMLDDSAGKAFTIALADQVMRFTRSQRGAQRFRSLIAELNPPKYLGAFDRTLLRIAAVASRFVPWIVMPQVAAQVRRESRNVILSGEHDALSAYLSQREKSGTRVNLNQLGEAVLGEGEAGRRLEAVLERLADPAVDYVSVKISAIFSQIHLVGYRATLEEIKQRLRILYRAAIANPRPDDRPKFVNLDMEEYRDLNLTVDGFCEVLSEPEFQHLEAGIVLQAYLPDSYQTLIKLTTWAQNRRAGGGSGIKVRLVKGANLAMEKVEATLHDWEQAPYHSKLEVDANYKRMLQYACTPENLESLRIGVASHNLFDIAYALLLREKLEQESADQIEFEMLEGMANAQAATVQKRASGLIMYAPIVQRDHFQSAIAYLVRRLEENTQDGNFLRDLFALQEGSDAWQRQKESFLAACELANSSSLRSSSNRTQNRMTEVPVCDPTGAPFQNAADTDFALEPNRQWIQGIVNQWSTATLPPVTFSTAHANSAKLADGHDPSRPGTIAYRYELGDDNDAETTLARASAAQSEWQELGFEGRAAILRNVAAVIARHRGDTIGCMILDAGKAVTEADAEISEAIDFANYYARSLDASSGWFDGAQPQTLGTVLVTPPWNFPYAIPAGGCMAALMAGNTVILKPPLESVLTASKVAEHLWEAGVPRDVLQFLTVPDNDTGKRLVTDDRVSAVILTGAYETARMFKQWKPQLRLSAETSGKNSLIITQAADVDLAIKDLVKGAFGHAGQKCSATSLALVESAVLDDPVFLRQLKDAAESMRVGPAWQLSSVVTPLIREPGDDLLRALTTLDPGESWLLEPRMVEDNPCLWSPGIRLGVARGSWFHRTECFGPVLGIIAVRDLDEAIAIQNDNAFGLTGGIHSLDEQETALWKKRVEVGNAYVNRSTTGAIVQRQPFGGWKCSTVGTGAKAGGPNYVASFAHWSDNALPKHRTALRPALHEELQKLASPLDATAQEKLLASAESYTFWWNEHFSIDHDPTALDCESNIFRYRPRHQVILRSNNPADELLPILQVSLACRICGVPVELSTATKCNVSAFPNQITESDADFAWRLEGHCCTNRSTVIRSTAALPLNVMRAANDANISIHAAPPLVNGRIELLHYLSEQSVSETQHRYGTVRTSSKDCVFNRA